MRVNARRDTTLDQIASLNPTALLANDVPLIDLRAPVEFAQGALPTSTNLPLLSDADRHEIGLVYRTEGREAAVARGHQLVSGPTRAQRIQAWLEFAANHPDCWLYCWRGGLRSQIAQAWLKDAGRAVPRVAGGYKCLRRACLDTLENTARDTKPWFVLAGRTGSGKTQIIQRLAHAIDLEGLARHRGSAFGAHPGGQPTPVAFENALAVAALRHAGSALVLEDESRTIGRLALPNSWYARMAAAPLVLLKATTETRVRNIRSEYVDEPLARGIAANELQDQLTASLDRIRKRLGGERHRRVGAALAEGFRTGDHEAWIGLLLAWYYDPMYDYQLAAKRERIIFSGDARAVTEFLKGKNELG